MLRRSLIAAVALSVALVSGCADTPRIPPADPTPTAAPHFASDEEALAAATEVYEEYWSVSSSVLQRGGEGADDLRPLVVESLYDREAQSFADFQARGWRLVGEPSVISTQLQQLMVVDSTSLELFMYACVSSEGTDVVDSQGNSVVDPGREQLSTFEAALLFEDEGWIVLDSDIWQGSSACD